jgi:hypothetical protein
VLPGSETVRRSHDDYPHVAGVGRSQIIGEGLAARVGARRSALTRLFLVLDEGVVQGGSVDLVGRHMDDQLDPTRSGRVQDRARAVDVRTEERGLVRLAPGHVRLGREVDDDARTVALHEVAKARVGDVESNRPDLVRNAARVGGIGVGIHVHDVGAIGDEADKGGADEPEPAGDQDPPGHGAGAMSVSDVTVCRPR